MTSAVHVQLAGRERSLPRDGRGAGNSPGNSWKGVPGTLFPGKRVYRGAGECLLVRSLGAGGRERTCLIEWTVCVRPKGMEI